MNQIKCERGNLERPIILMTSVLIGLTLILSGASCYNRVLYKSDTEIQIQTVSANYALQDAGPHCAKKGGKAKLIKSEPLHDQWGVYHFECIFP